MTADASSPLSLETFRDATAAQPVAVGHAPSLRANPVLEWGLRVGLVVLAGLIALLFGTQWNRWVGDSPRQTTDDAYIQGELTPLSARIDGYVRHVAVNDFQFVKQGDLILQIEDDDYKARVAQAEAAVAQATAAIQNIKARKATQKAQVGAAENAVTAANADLVRDQDEQARQRALLASTYGTQQKVEQADAAARRAAATLAQDRALLDAQRRQLAVLDSEELELRADAKAKEAALTLARITLGYTTITAPVSGEVGQRGVFDGQYVHAGTQVISIVPLYDVWVLANYRETQLTHVTVGQKAQVRIDTFPGFVIDATVDSIAPASGSQFSLLPPDNATGNFTKVVQRIPVKLGIRRDNPLAGRLRPGMSVEATILTNGGPTK